MSNINVSGRMARKTTTKDLNGNIINLIDESDGGWIIRNRQVVNQEKWNEMVQKEKDRMEAAKAISMQKVDANAPDRTGTATQVSTNNNKIAELEKKIADQDTKLDAILKALQK